MSTFLPVGAFLKYPPSLSQLLVFYGLIISNMYDYETKGSTPFLIGVCLKSNDSGYTSNPCCSDLLLLVLRSDSHSQFGSVHYFRYLPYLKLVPVLVGLVVAS